jgi:hypothetical protein
VIRGEIIARGCGAPPGLLYILLMTAHRGLGPRLFIGRRSAAAGIRSRFKFLGPRPQAALLGRFAADAIFFPIWPVNANNETICETGLTRMLGLKHRVTLGNSASDWTDGRWWAGARRPPLRGGDRRWSDPTVASRKWAVGATLAGCKLVGHNDFVPLAVLRGGNPADVGHSGPE